MNTNQNYSVQTQAGKAGEYISEVLTRELPRLDLYNRLAARLTERIEQDERIINYPDTAACFVFATREVYKKRKAKNEFYMAALIRRVSACVKSLAVVLPAGAVSLLNERPKGVAL